MTDQPLPAEPTPSKPVPPDVGTSAALVLAPGVDRKRIIFILLGVVLFLLIYLSPAWPDAVDPEENVFPLSQQGKAALALFALAATWWVTEVVPIGITAITIVVMQSLFSIREGRAPYTDVMDPSVWFIFGSLMIGMVFTKTGLTRRVAYKMLALVGERTSMIYLGTFVMTAGLTLVMAHTAVAATVYPLLMAIYALYRDDGMPTKFGKGLFIGMAFVAGAGSIITLLGAARGAVAISFFYGITGKSVSFFELTYYMLPVGVLMTVLLWVYFMLWYPPERKTIPGLRDRAQRLYASLGRTSRDEKVGLLIVVAVILTLSLRSLFPHLGLPDKSAVILVATVLFFMLRIISLEDLESTPWNIILLFGGAISIGFCLWETGAAQWLAVMWLGMFETAPTLVFILGIAFFVLIMTNVIMNVAAIAIVMPVALTMADMLHVAPEIILYSSLVTAGMPFLLLVGAAPNAIAYGSGMFTTREFFTTGVPASILLMVVLALFVAFVWPLMGMPIWPISDAELDAFQGRVEGDEPFLIEEVLAEKGRDYVEEVLHVGQMRRPERSTWPTQWLYLFAMDRVEARKLAGEERDGLCRRAFAYLEESYEITSRTIEEKGVPDLAEMRPLLREALALAALEAGEMETAREHATGLLEEAGDPESWNHGNIIHNANEISGRIALRVGDLQEAKRRLLEAGKTPGSAQLDSFGPSMDLPRELLAQNEREVVIEYLDLVARFWRSKDQTALLNQWKGEIRAGQVPDHPKWRGPGTATPPREEP